MIVNREGRLVVRPDSGDPPVIVVQVGHAGWAGRCEGGWVGGAGGRCEGGWRQAAGRWDGGLPHILPSHPCHPTASVFGPQLLDILGEAFAEHCTKTSTGFKVLPPFIRIIQGDGVSYETLGTILQANHPLQPPLTTTPHKPATPHKPPPSKRTRSHEGCVCRASRSRLASAARIRVGGRLARWVPTYRPRLPTIPT